MTCIIRGLRNNIKVYYYGPTGQMSISRQRTNPYLHEEGDFGAVAICLFLTAQLSKHKAVMAVVLTHASVIIDLVAATTVANDARVG